MGSSFHLDHFIFGKKTFFFFFLKKEKLFEQVEAEGRILLMILMQCDYYSNIKSYINKHVINFTFVIQKYKKEMYEGTGKSQSIIRYSIILFISTCLYP